MYVSSMDTLEKFARDFLGGKLEPYMKSEAVPEDNDGPVKVRGTGVMIPNRTRIDQFEMQKGKFDATNLICDMNVCSFGRQDKLPLLIFPTASHQRRKKWEVCASQLGAWH